MQTQISRAEFIMYNYCNGSKKDISSNILWTPSQC